MNGPIVIGYDGTGSGDDALTLGAILSRAASLPPLVVTVYPEENPIGMGRVDAEWVAYMPDHAKELSACARLLVCGSRGYGPVRRVLLGGVSSRLIRRAACPVVVVPRCADQRVPNGASLHT